MRNSLIVATAMAGLGLACAGLGQPALAQGSAASQAASTAAQSGGQPLSSADKSWLTETANGASYELSLAKMGAEKANKPAVKDYAQTVVKDHETLNSAMQEIAARHGTKLSPSMSAKDTSKLSELRGMSGEGFDTAFLAEMKRINSEDKGTLQKEVATTQDLQVKQFAQEMQAADAKHEALAQKIGS